MGAARWRFRGVPASSHDSQRLPDPARCCPSLHARVSQPLSWPHSSLAALHSPGHRPYCSCLSRDLCCHLRTSVTRVLEALYPPISAITHAGGDRVQFGVPPPVHPGHILFFSLDLLEFSEMSFENLNCCFQKDCKIPVLNFKNKIFIFHLKVKLERRVKAVIFSNWKRKPARDHVTEHSSCNPSLLSLLLHHQQHGITRPALGRQGQGKRAD